jgi:CO dehydrogenase maturation factor
MCGAHATVRGFLGEIVARAESDRHIIVDMEAGLEHLSRGTGRHVSRLVAVLEPYYRSMETARSVTALASELGINDVAVVANKVRDDGDRKAIADFCRVHAMRLVGEVPFDGSLAEVERGGGAPIDAAPDSPAVRAITELAVTLSDQAGRAMRQPAG